MKRTLILPTIVLMSISLFMVSCRTSRVYAEKERVVRRTPPPPPPRYNPPVTRYQPAVALVISPKPGFRMSQNRDGRYYHRSPQGFMYWKGYDNRFYLDRSYLSRVRYDKWEYKEWKRYSKSHNRR